LTGQQGHGLATGIADERMDNGLFDSAAAFQSDAIRFDYEIQSTARSGGQSSVTESRLVFQTE
jgi:hypothetical protein